MSHSHAVARISTAVVNVDANAPTIPLPPHPQTTWFGRRLSVEKASFTRLAGIATTAVVFALCLTGPQVCVTNQYDDFDGKTPAKVVLESLGCSFAISSISGIGIYLITEGALRLHDYLCPYEYPAIENV